MDVFENKIVKIGGMGLYIVLMTVSFYCACYRLPVGLKYAINMLVFGWACAMFFIHPLFERAKFCMRFFLLFSFPYMLFWMWSVGIWISEFQNLAFIVRGSQNVIYMMTNLLFVAGAIYLFGKHTLTLTVVGMTVANGLVALQVAARAGIGTFISEYIRLLVTFADDTGSAMRSMELHDMVYGWGVCAVYYLIHKEKNWKIQIFCLAVSWLFFTMGFKRIAIPAVVGAIGIYYVMYWLKPKHLWTLATIAAATVGVLIFLYLISIKTHVFFDFCDKHEINLMSRDVLFTYYEDFYQLSPTYLGQGIRFIYAYGTEHQNDRIMVNAVHNVYLEFYIEVGFWCWWIWIFYELAFRIHRVSKWYGDIPAYALMAMNFYVFFTFLTDNTSFYFPNNVLYRMAVMVWCFEVAEKRARTLEINELTKGGIHENNCIRSPVVW